MRRENNLRIDLYFRQESIGNYLEMLPEENIFMIDFYGEKGENTLYFGPAENAAEYDEVMGKMVEMIQD